MLPDGLPTEDGLLVEEDLPAEDGLVVDDLPEVWVEVLLDGEGRVSLLVWASQGAQINNAAANADKE